MKRILMLGLLALSLLCGTAFAKTGEGMTIWFDTGGSVGDGYGTIVQNGAKAAAADMGCELRLLYSDWNPETMITHFRNAVAARPDGIVVMGHPETPHSARWSMLRSSRDRRDLDRHGLAGNAGSASRQGFRLCGDGQPRGQGSAEEVLRRTNLKKGDRAFVWGLKRIPDRGGRAGYRRNAGTGGRDRGLSGNHPRNRQGPRARCPGRGGAARASPRHQGHHRITAP
ncbi:MAG: hypothetical protein ACLR7Z_08765 [Bilophila wadsworthia]